MFTYCHIPRLPLRRASANLGLFCLSNASWSGLAKNISLMIRGSSSTGGFLAAIEVLAPVGTLMLLKSKVAKPVGKAAREMMFLFYFTKKVCDSTSLNIKKILID